MNCGSLDIHLQGNEENNFAEVKEMYPNIDYSDWFTY